VPGVLRLYGHAISHMKRAVQLDGQEPGHNLFHMLLVVQGFDRRPGLASINVLAATLRGAGATKTPWKLAIIGFFLIRIPITYTLARPEDGSFWAWGLKGAWVGMLVDLNARGLMHAIAYFKGGWTKTKV